ncbi:MAG: DUF853 domain-containing protein, partial [Bacteroidetes bacterium]|nr:DUF853 domain-containing protein [Bacteroidota bacterium]
NYPLTDYYDISTLLTELGIGEALVTALNEKGIPTPLVHTMLRAPQSRMDVLTEKEIDSIIKKSSIIKKYNEDIDRESAYEILNGKIEEARKESHQEELRKQRDKGTKASSRRRKEKSTLEKVMSNTTTRQIGRTIARELTRGLLGALGIKTSTRRRRKSSSWF